jgi:hypothetical protein
MVRTATVVGFAIGLLVAAGCEKRSEAPDPCAGGGCEAEACPLCDLDADGAGPTSTVRQHSDRSGTLAEGLLGECPLPEEEVPPLAELDSSSIPEFDGKRSRRSNMNAGEVALQEIDLHEHMMGMQSRIFECIDLAACYEGGDALGGGDLDFRFELAPSGKVMAVSVTPSEGLAHPGVVHCARRSLYELRFPRYDGGAMMVSYSMQIEVADAA